MKWRLRTIGGPSEWQLERSDWYGNEASSNTYKFVRNGRYSNLRKYSIVDWVGK